MIKTVRIKNFKSLGDVSVSLEPVTVLIGRSGTGKTNFVEALRFFRNYLFSRNTNFVHGLYGEWHNLLHALAARPRNLAFAVRFTVPGITDDYTYELTIKEDQACGEEKLELGQKVLYHQRDGKWVQAPEVLTPPSPGPLALGAVMGIPEINVAHVVLTNGIGWYSFFDNVLLSGVQNTNVALNGLRDYAENYLETLAAIHLDLQSWQNLKEIVAALKLLDSTIKAVDLGPDRQKVVVSRDAEGKALSLFLPQQSEGLRRFLAHLLALYQTPPKQTLIFEEPEKGIHPGALEALVEQFKACPNAGRGQVILTTHSPDFLDHFEAHEIRVVEIEDYQTRIGPVAAEQVEAIREKLLQPGELLTVDSARVATAAV